MALPTIGDSHGRISITASGAVTSTTLTSDGSGAGSGGEVGRHVGLDVLGLERHAGDDVDRVVLPRLGVGGARRGDERRDENQGHDDGTHREDRSTGRGGPLLALQWAVRARTTLPATTLLLALAAAGCRAPAPMLSPPPSPPVTLPPLADVVRACAFEVSCLHDPPAATMNNCVFYLLAGLEGLPGFFVPPAVDVTDFRRYVDCARSSGDCASVLACATQGHDAAFCTAHPGTTCDGNLVVPCPPATATPDAALFTIDCAARGLGCVEANGGASCTNGISCDPQAEPAGCDGNRYFTFCDDTTRLRYRADCTRSPIANATCRAGGDTVGCLPSGPPCTGDRCDGDTWVRCLGGDEVPLDCAELGATCGLVKAAPACVPLASECSDGTTTDACSGDSLTTCVDNQLFAVPCGSIGLATCVPMMTSNIPICSD